MIAPQPPPSRRVSHETIRQLRAFADLVRKYSAHVNLVAPGDLEHLWKRHIEDSAQLIDLAPIGWEKWVDLGSGGGFPGLVIAIMSHEIFPRRAVVLIEADQRKAEFLSKAAADFAPRTKIIVERIEDVAPLEADVISARAVAPLRVLMGYARRHMALGGLSLLQKGRDVDGEVADAAGEWNFVQRKFPSRTDPNGVILRIDRIGRK